MILFAAGCTTVGSKPTDEPTGTSGSAQEPSEASPKANREGPENMADSADWRGVERSRTGRLPERVPPAEEAPVLAEAPDDLLASIVSDLVATIGVEASQVEILSSEAIVCSDGSLGCPQPGEVYPQSSVSGYRVLLRAGGQRYDYRAAVAGFFKRCPVPTLDISD